MYLPWFTIIVHDDLYIYIYISIYNYIIKSKKYMAGLHKTSKCLIFIVVPRNFEKVGKAETS